MKNPNLLIVSLLLMALNFSYSQVEEKWVARHAGWVNFDGHCRILTTDEMGNVYVAGYTWSPGALRDFITIKYNSSGEEQWFAGYNDSTCNGDDFIRAIAVDNNGNIFVTGTSATLINYADWVTIKYNPEGVYQWKVNYHGGVSDDQPFDIAVDNFGDVYVTGSSIGASGDMVTVKYNTSGIQQWEARYSSPDSRLDIAYRLILDDSANVYITGYSTSENNGRDFTTIKYNSSGVQKWVSVYDGTANSSDEAYDIALDNEGNVYVSGPSNGTGTGIDYVTVKYNNAGVQKWVANYNKSGTGGDIPSAITTQDENNIYVTGSSGSKMTTIKYNSTGDTVWTREYFDYPADNNATAITLDQYGDVYVTGWINRGGSDQRDYATIKYNPDGNMQWVMTYDGPGSLRDDPWAITIDDSGYVYVAGESWNGSEFDITTIKYSQSVVGVSDDDIEIPSSFSLFQNYPNPFNPSTKIKFTVPQDARGERREVSLKVYDVLGKEIATLVNEEKPAGEYEVEFNADGLTSGVYFYQIKVGSFIATKKMVLIK